MLLEVTFMSCGEAGGSCECSVCLLFQEGDNVRNLTEEAKKSRVSEVVCAVAEVHWHKDRIVH